MKKAMSSLARRPMLAVGLVGLLSLAVNLALAIAFGIPQPHVHDEFSYLLAADTFLHGRCANPSHPCGPYFETLHVLQTPSYASKYPPGQGLVLAAGTLIGGHSIVGVWLSGALACAGVCWMLLAWVRPRQALLGGFLIAFHPTVVLWGRGYWGGALAMLGGSLLLGGMRLAVDAPSTRMGLIMGSGVALLAITRPYEGAAISLLALGTLIVWRACRCSGLLTSCVRVLPALGLPVAFTIAGIAFYNARVTGEPGTLPYLVYESQHSNAPIFLFQGRSGRIIDYPNPEIALYDRWSNLKYDEQKTLGFPWNVISPLLRAAKAFFPFLAPTVLDRSEGAVELIRGLPVAALQLPLFFAPWLVFSRRLRPAALLLGGFTCALALSTWKLNHYGAPGFGLMIILTLESIRVLRQSGKLHGRRLGQTALPALLVLYAVWPLILLALNPEPTTRCKFGQDRAALAARLHAKGGRHLVIVRYGPDHNVQEEWVYNGADIDQAPVVWARDRGNARNQPLLDHFANRRVWLLEPDTQEPRLQPYPTSPIMAGAGH